MTSLLNSILVLFIVAWLIFGGWLVMKYNHLFGPHPDDPSETPGARSFGVAHIIIVWFGTLVLSIYFLFR